MNRRFRPARAAARRGFTLAEIIVVIIILGILATVIAPRLIGRVGQAKHSTALSNAAALSSAMSQYALDCGLPPEGATLDILWERPSDVPADAWKGPYVNSKDQLLDPWGRPYLLVVPGEKNVDFDIVSWGKDGKTGGEGEDADITKP